MDDRSEFESYCEKFPSQIKAQTTKAGLASGLARQGYCPGMGTDRVRRSTELEGMVAWPGHGLLVRREPRPGPAACLDGDRPGPCRA